MDIRQLRYFLAIVEHGSFSRAAAVLHVAQPALSLHVRNMEADLGTPLLVRSPRGVVPTDAGVILVRNARIILDQLAIAEDEIRQHENDPSGEVRLGLPGTISQILAVPLVKAMRHKYPKIKLRIAEAMSGFILDWMRESKVDLAVLYGHVSDHSVESVHLLEERLCFFGPADLGQTTEVPPQGEPIPFADLARMPLILPGESHGLRELLVRQAAAAGLLLNTVIDVDSYGNIKELVHQGLGCSVLPEYAVADEIARGRLCGWKIVDPEIRRTVYLAHSIERPQTNAVAAVRRTIRELLPELVRSGSWSGARILETALEDPAAT